MSTPTKRLRQRVEALEEANGRAADQIENLLFALKLKVSDSIHLEGIRGTLPGILETLRGDFASIEEAP